jgi:ATP phosphoribosyltransferase regulatory subunit
LYRGMSSQLSKIPPGVQYIFDSEVQVRRLIERKVMDVFAGWSYSEIILPIFDYADLFELGMGKEQAQMTYRFTGRDGRLLALRPEMTSLVARTVATRFRSSPRPIRLCYSGEVFRWNEPRAGRQYEFHQIGLEYIGSDRLEADTEVIVVAIEALSQLGLQDFTITLSHVDFFNGVAERLQLDDEQRRQMRELIDHKDCDGLAAFLKRCAEPECGEEFCQLVMLAGRREVLDRARCVVSNQKSLAALEDLERIYQIAEEINVGKYIEINLGDMCGLDYYTGLTFKIYVPGLGAALGSGGRYDNLLGKFGSPEPAVGFSLCLDWMAQLAGPRLKSELAASSNQAIKLSAAGDLVSAFKQAKRLRESGQKVQIV